VNGAAVDSTSADPVLRLRGVARRFGGVHALRDVDLEIAAGERRAILGPNGAGKTTLFNVISGEVAPTAGTVELFGREITLLPGRMRAKLGLTRTFQKSRLFPGLSAEDNLYLAVLGVRDGHCRIFRSRRDEEMLAQARVLVQRVGLSGREEALVGSLSHGEQRQLEVGMALAGSPKLMMLDEPASGLSRGERSALTDLLLGLDPSITLVLIEHDMDIALSVAERVTIMHEGRAVAAGTPDEMRANRMVHELYLGGSYADA
jgi:branched-chain amino acid transport system ATP-binding protein